MAPQLRELATPYMFGCGVSSVDNIPRNLPLYTHYAMPPALDHYHLGEQAGFDMSSVYRPRPPYPYRAATSTQVVGVDREPGPSVSVDTIKSRAATIKSKTDAIESKADTIKSKADTSEMDAQPLEPEFYAPRLRITFEEWQLQKLNDAFQRNRYLTTSQKGKLALRLGVKDSQVQTWFQNKRSAIKRQQASLVVESKNARSVRASKAAASRALLLQQPVSLVSQQEVVAQHRYSLMRENKVISTAMAQSTAEALQVITANLIDTPEAQYPLSVADYSQSGSPGPGLPATTPKIELTDADDESGSSTSTET
ncbi:homeobox domain-containing protein [Endozoicomonas sp. GU-1]|nr:homeobox domain-containing protein [Endozoicomonas sp. GU-1]WBA87631.1 homeobox domain-containing protein [Endozoicomonas sp. GU-1]